MGTCPVCPVTMYSGIRSPHAARSRDEFYSVEVPTLLDNSHTKVQSDKHTLGVERGLRIQTFDTPHPIPLIYLDHDWTPKTTTVFCFYKTYFKLYNVTKKKNV